MKKTLILLLSIVLLAASLVGCGGEAEAPSASPSDSDASSPTPTESDGNDIGREPPETSFPPDGPAPPETEGSGESGESLEELLQKVYDGIDESLELPFLMTIPLSNDMEYGEQGVAYYIGTKDVPFSEGIASEAAIGAIPYSVVLLRLERNTDVENAKKLIRDNVDPMKWICALADFVEVDSVGDLLILIMTSNENSPGLGAAIHEGFLNLG